MSVLKQKTVETGDGNKITYQLKRYSRKQQNLSKPYFSGQYVYKIVDQEYGNQYRSTYNTKEEAKNAFKDITNSMSKSGSSGFGFF